MKWLSLQVNFRGVFNNSLHRHLNKLVEGIQLLTNQTFFVKIWTDNNPARFLPQIPSDFFPVVIVIYSICDGKALQHLVVPCECCLSKFNVVNNNSKITFSYHRRDHTWLLYYLLVFTILTRTLFWLSAVSIPRLQWILLNCSFLAKRFRHCSRSWTRRAENWKRVLRHRTPSSLELWNKSKSHRLLVQTDTKRMLIGIKELFLTNLLFSISSDHLTYQKTMTMEIQIMITSNLVEKK